MSKIFDRREAVAGMGAVTLESLLAARCSLLAARGSDSSSGSASTSVSTTQGTTATVEPQTRAAADLFDDSSSCTLTAEETEVPYYFDADAIRSDIREDRPGDHPAPRHPRPRGGRVQSARQRCHPPLALRRRRRLLRLRVGVNGAGGRSGGPPPGGGGPGGGSEPTDEQTYLRGAQVTNSDGIASSRRSSRAGTEATPCTSTRRSTSTSAPC